MVDNSLQEVLKELKITKLEELDKFSALQLAILFPKLSESAFETLFKQVPNYFKLLEEGLIVEKEVIIKSLDNNAENMKSLDKYFDIVLDTLRECQKRPNLTFEESKYYMDKMVVVLEIASQKDTLNKGFIERNVKVISDSKNSDRVLALSLLAGIAGVGLVALGVVTNNPYITKQVTKKASDKVVEMIDKKRLIK